MLPGSRLCFSLKPGTALQQAYGWDTRNTIPFLGDPASSCRVRTTVSVIPNELADALDLSPLLPLSEGGRSYPSARANRRFLTRPASTIIVW